MNTLKYFGMKMCITLVTINCATVRVLKKFHGLIFCAWQENSWGINFHGHGCVVGTIFVKFEYASYCGLIFMDKNHTTKSMKIYTPRKFLCIQ